MYAIGQHEWCVNIGLGNDFVRPGYKPLSCTTEDDVHVV